MTPLMRVLVLIRFMVMGTRASTGPLLVMLQDSLVLSCHAPKVVMTSLMPVMEMILSMVVRARILLMQELVVIRSMVVWVMIRLLLVLVGILFGVVQVIVIRVWMVPIPFMREPGMIRFMEKAAMTRFMAKMVMTRFQLVLGVIRSMVEEVQILFRVVPVMTP